MIRFEATVTRDDGQSVTPEQMSKLIRKIVGVCQRNGCTIRGEWRLGDPPEREDLFDG